MGIESLYSWISRVRYPGVTAKKMPRGATVLSLLLDFNGTLHFARNYAYASDRQVFRSDEEYMLRKKSIESGVFKPEQLKLDMLRILEEKLDEIVETIAPTQTLVIAIDGVAPPAKLKQQRSRRYLAGRGKSVDLKAEVLDSTMLTPGTPIMRDIDNFIKSYIASKRLHLPPRVIYSNHMVHGEGEHKIMSLIRKGAIPDGDGYHVMWGKDADLNMLTFLSPYRDKFIVIREDFSDIIMTGVFVNGIVNDMNGLYNKNGMNLNVPKDIAIRDFVVLMYMAGNDFLPRLFAFGDMDELVNILIAVYQHVIPATRMPVVNPDYSINWEVLQVFIATLSQYEKTLLEKKASYTYAYPSQILEAACGSREPIIKEGVRRGHDPSHEVKDFDMAKFRMYWYWQIFKPRTTEGADIVKHLEAKGSQIVTEADVSRMAKWYLYGMQWCIYYYVGIVDASYFRREQPKDFVLPPVIPYYQYPYRSSPLMVDIAAELELMNKEKKKLPLEFNIIPHIYISPIHQMVAVLPPSSASLMPKEQQHLIFPGGELAYIAPRNFPTENEAKRNDYHVVPILPEVDIIKLVLAVNRTIKTKKYGARVFQMIPSMFKDAEDEAFIHESAAVVPRQSRGRQQRSSSGGSYGGRSRSRSRSNSQGRRGRNHSGSRKKFSGSPRPNGHGGRGGKGGRGGRDGGGRGGRDGGRRSNSHGRPKRSPSGGYRPSSRAQSRGPTQGVRDGGKGGRDGGRYSQDGGRGTRGKGRRANSQDTRRTPNVQARDDRTQQGPGTLPPKRTAQQASPAQPRAPIIMPRMPNATGGTPSGANTLPLPKE